MAVHEAFALQNGFYPNGLLPNEGLSVLDLSRWSRAEEKTAELIACIQPNKPSEEFRNAVACYVQRLIMKCFNCQVFTFGSVPLKTYLPDGDIDLTAFSTDQTLKDTWANLVRDKLEGEKKSVDSEFCVKEVQYIQAEVKIIKCLVENIVVDISFNQLGGLCTLCFLEEVDHLINQNHLFKRSIILIKAWCYYESRTLGAHHGLISTYALETLVLYIFHVFNNSFAGPLEVLYRFLEFFSKFDWDNFCVSLWGPVPKNRLPDIAADPPRKDSGDLLLNKVFLDACSSVYAVFPCSQEHQDQPFVSKHFNVIDPLRTNNNLGRSVSKGNFFRIRSAFAFGAQQLSSLLNCPKEKINSEVNRFFMNSWDQHGKGHLLDALGPDGSQQCSLNRINGSFNLKNYSVSKDVEEDSTSYEFKAQVPPTNGSHVVSSLHGSNSLKKFYRINNLSTITDAQRKTNANLVNVMVSGQNHQIGQYVHSNKNTDSSQRIRSGPDYTGNVNGSYHFVRRNSTPESSKASSSGEMHSQTFESRSGQSASAVTDDNRRRNFNTEMLHNYVVDSLTEYQLSSRLRSSHLRNYSNSSPNICNGESDLSTIGDELFSSYPMLMQCDTQDFINMLASSRVHINGQIQMPVNVSPCHVPSPVSPSDLASLECGGRKAATTVPVNIASSGSLGTNMQYSQGSGSLSASNYFPRVEVSPNCEEMVETVGNSFLSTDINQKDGLRCFLPELNLYSGREIDSDKRTVGSGWPNERQQVTLLEFNFTPSHGSSSDIQSKKDLELVKDTGEFIREHSGDKHWDKKVSSVAHMNIPLAHSSSLGSTASSEGSCDGSFSKISKLANSEPGRQTDVSKDPSIAYGLHKNCRQYESELVGNAFHRVDDDNRHWIPLSTVGTKEAGSTSSHVTYQIPCSLIPTQVAGLNSMLPFPRGAVSGSHHRGLENYGLLPFSFYQTVSPPFRAMLLANDFPSERGISGASSSNFHYDGGGLIDCNISHSNQNISSSENHCHPERLSNSTSLKRDAFVDPPQEKSYDILNSDVISHWKNLQYGRLCQNSQHLGFSLYPSSVSAPLMYLPGHVPWFDPGRPPANANHLTQPMDGDLNSIPISSLNLSSVIPSGINKIYNDEIPRHGKGTRTYFSDTKISDRGQPLINTRNHRVPCGYDRKDRHADRENCNINSMPRHSGCDQDQSLSDTTQTRIDQFIASNWRFRSSDSYKHNSLSSYISKNVAFSSLNTVHQSSANTAYNFSAPSMLNRSEVPPSETAEPCNLKLYPNDANIHYSSLDAELEFEPSDVVHPSGTNDLSWLGYGSLEGNDEEKNRQRNSANCSPHQPVSPGQRNSTHCFPGQPLTPAL